MARDTGRQIQQSRMVRGDRPVRSLGHGKGLFTFEQRHPAIQVVGDYADHEMVGVYRPLPRRIGCNSNVLVGLLDPIFHRRPLVVERHQLGLTPFPAVDVGQEHAVAPNPAIEESDLIRVRRVRLRLIRAQAHKALL